MNEAKKERVTIVVCSGDLDRALMAFTLINAAAALDMKVSVFFTFGGIDIVTKEGARRDAVGLFEKIHSFFARGGHERLGFSKKKPFWNRAFATKSRIKAQEKITL